MDMELGEVFDIVVISKQLVTDPMPALGRHQFTVFTCDDTSVIGYIFHFTRRYINYWHHEALTITMFGRVNATINDVLRSSNTP